MLKRQIAVLDYGMGNLLSVKKAFDFLEIDARIVSTPDGLIDATHLVMPGVGAFADCMKSLDEKGFIAPVINFIKSGRPFLGICLGLHVLFSESDEFGVTQGLDIFKGRVERLPDSVDEQRLKIPHMGWNNIKIMKKDGLFNGIADESYFYFVHSYAVRPEDENIVLSLTGYGKEFVSSISHDNVWGCQFHPEKSQQHGLRILKNFGEMES